MKKLLSILFSILLVSTLVFSTTSCKNKEESDEALDETVTPVTLTIEEETDDNDKTIKTLTEISLSASAKDYIDKEDLAGLNKLFATHKESGDAKVKADIDCFAIDATNGKVTLTIPEDVTHIAANSVVNLSFITNLEVGSKVQEIEKGAFVGLTGLESIKLPFIGGKVGAVNDAKLFTYIFGTIGTDGLTSITQNYNEGSASTATFYAPTSLKTVIITGNVEETVEDVKYYINDDNEHVVLGENDEAPEGKTAYTISSASYKTSAVQPYAFYGVTTIENVQFDGEITSIPEYTFYGCTGIKNLNFKDTTITTIGKYAYANCTGLRVLTLGAVALEEGAFSGCTSLGAATETKKGGLDVSLVTSFGKDAFAGCTSLNLATLTLGTHTAESLEDAFDEGFFETEDTNP